MKAEATVYVRETKRSHTYNTHSAAIVCSFEGKEKTSIPVKVVSSSSLNYPLDTFLAGSDFLTKKDVTYTNTLVFVSEIAWKSSEGWKDLLKSTSDFKGLQGYVLANNEDNVNLAPDLQKTIEEYYGTVLLMKESDSVLFKESFMGCQTKRHIIVVPKEGG